MCLVLNQQIFNCLYFCTMVYKKVNVWLTQIHMCRNTHIVVLFLLFLLERQRESKWSFHYLSNAGLVREHNILYVHMCVWMDKESTTYLLTYFTITHCNNHNGLTDWMKHSKALGFFSKRENRGQKRNSGA